MSVDRSNWPVWVRLGLWTIKSRQTAWIFVWLSLGTAVVFLGWGLFNLGALSGVVLIPVALWYYLALCWVDRYGEWG